MRRAPGGQRGHADREGVGRGRRRAIHEHRADGRGRHQRRVRVAQQRVRLLGNLARMKCQLAPMPMLCRWSDWARVTYTMGQHHLGSFVAKHSVNTMQLSYIEWSALLCSTSGR